MPLIGVSVPIAARTKFNGSPLALEVGESRGGFELDLTPHAGIL